MKKDTHATGSMTELDSYLVWLEDLVAELCLRANVVVPEKPTGKGKKGLGWGDATWNPVPPVTESRDPEP